MVMVGGDLYGCANRKNKGTCDNTLTMRREVLERSVLSGLKTHLLSPELVKEFVAEFQRETNRLNAQRGQRSKAAQTELARVEAEIRYIISAVKQGMLHASMREALTELESVIATFLMRSAESFSINQKSAASLYLLSHGAVKLFLVVMVLRDRWWAYPVFMAALVLLISYQTYQLILDFLLWLVALTMLDAVVLWLTWHEYRLHRASL